MRAALPLALLMGLWAAAAAAQDEGEAATGYRMEDYRAPTPEALEGATVVDDDAAHALWKTRRALFVDVMPRPPKPDLPEGTVWRERPRDSIPGALWLPNVGYGALAPATDAYFRNALETATDGDRETPLVFFCLASCWMSWNAAKRALEDYGYTVVFWYPEGTDGWDFAGYPLSPVRPEPRTSEE